MKKSTFESIGDKLLLRLNEDVQYLTEKDMFDDGNGSGKLPEEKITDSPIKSAIISQADNVAKKTDNAREAHQKELLTNRNPEATSRMRDTAKFLHKKAIIDREDEINKKRKLRLTEEYDDADIFLIGEELEEALIGGASVSTKSPAEILLNKKQDELRRVTEDNKDKLEAAKNRSASINDQQKLEKQKTTEKLNSDIAEARERQNNIINKIKADNERKKESLEKQIDRTKMVADFQKNQGGTSMNESLFSRSNEKKADGANKKADNINAKIIKLEDFITKYKKKYPDVENPDSPRFKKYRMKLIKLEELKHKYDVALRKFSIYDAGVANDDFQKSITETAYLNGIMHELTELEEQFTILFEEEEKKEVEQPQTEENDVPDLCNAAYEDPLLNKIAEEIRKECSSSNPNKDKIKQLKFKFYQLYIDQVNKK